MRLWSIHPEYLDARGLVALWREALLAQQVLRGNTAGYRRHPQLSRFRNSPDPLGAIAGYLHGVAEEAERRSYAFDRRRIGPERPDEKLPVTRGQLKYEFAWLLSKLEKRDPVRHSRLAGIENPRPHPMFRTVAGGPADWEKIRDKPR